MVLDPADPVALDFWTMVAEAYKDETHVIYEIANEPNNVAWDDVLAYHNAVIAAIRQSCQAKLALTEHGEFYPQTDCRVLLSSAGSEESLADVIKQIVAKLDETVKSTPSEALGAEEVAKRIKAGEDAVKAAEESFETQLKELQATYKESMDGLEKLKESSAPKIKLLKAATPSPAKDASKDEV